jgi:hypothetical protein
VGKIKLTESALRKLIREAVSVDPGDGVPGLLGKLLSMRWRQERGMKWDTIKAGDLKGTAPDRLASIAEDVRAYNTAVRKMNNRLDGDLDWGEEADLAERKLGDLIQRLSADKGHDGADYRDMGTYTELVDAAADVLESGDGPQKGVGRSYPHIEDIINKLVDNPPPGWFLDPTSLADDISTELVIRGAEVDSDTIEQFIDSLYL